VPQVPEALFRQEQRRPAHQVRLQSSAEVRLSSLQYAQQVALQPLQAHTQGSPWLQGVLHRFAAQRGRAVIALMGRRGDGEGGGYDDRSQGHL
jgi:hypothetical protein